MPAWRILRFTRTSRWDMVASGTRKARAISAVDSPARVRRASATWASVASAGWQQVKMSRSRSSVTPLSSGSGSSGSGTRAASRSLAAPRVSRRIRSVARLRAAVVSQAPGRRGTPSRGQVRRARAKASWAHSSARSQSPVIRMSVATTWPHSSRNASATAVSTSTTAAPSAGSPLRRTAGPGTDSRRVAGAVPLGARDDPAAFDADGRFGGVADRGDAGGRGERTARVADDPQPRPGRRRDRLVEAAAQVGDGEPGQRDEFAGVAGDEDGGDVGAGADGFFEGGGAVQAEDGDDAVAGPHRFAGQQVGG